MALIKCPECYSKISEKTHACPKCGYPLSDQIEMYHEDTFFGGIANTGVDELAALKSDGWTVVDGEHPQFLTKTKFYVYLCLFLSRNSEKQHYSQPKLRSIASYWQQKGASQKLRMLPG